jgi:hypothetical protein
MEMTFNAIDKIGKVFMLRFVLYPLRYRIRRYGDQHTFELNERFLISFYKFLIEFKISKNN